MQGDLNPSLEQRESEASVTKLFRYVWAQKGIRVSIALAALLLTCDVVISGCYLFSCVFGHIWFFVSLLKNLVQRPGWRIALIRIVFPPLTLGVALANSNYQSKVAEVNADRIVVACEQFHAANGTFPQNLQELVPRFLPYVPRAKYCLMFGEYRYFCYDGSHPILFWYRMPPFLRRVYRFDGLGWHDLD
jgi:hypothetical protein